MGAERQIFVLQLALDQLHWIFSRSNGRDTHDLICAHQSAEMSADPQPVQAIAKIEGVYPVGRRTFNAAKPDRSQIVREDLGSEEALERLARSIDANAQRVERHLLGFWHRIPRERIIDAGPCLLQSMQRADEPNLRPEGSYAPPPAPRRGA